MNTKIFIAIASFSTLNSISAFAEDQILDATLQPRESLLSVQNPYVSLYQKRLEVAQLSVQRSETIAENERIKWKRMESLGANGAVPAIEVDAQQTRWQIAKKRIEIADAHVEKARALLAIAKERTGAGLDMPVCAFEK